MSSLTSLRFLLRTEVTTLVLGASLSWFGGCGGGADSRMQCTNTTECGPDESCEAGFCEPACTPGVDCPEKDVSSGDASDGADAEDADVTDDVTAGDTDATSDGQDGEDGEDTSEDTTEPEELACEPDRLLTTYDEGRSFEVRFGERGTGLVTLPEGWTVDPVCCAAGCCQ